MKKLLIMAALMSAASLAPAMAQSKDDLIAQAVSAVPDELRAGATVVNYDAKGDPVVLRAGTNGVVCTPNQNKDNYSVNCYAQLLRAQHDLQAKEKAAGKDAKAIAADTDAAYASGQLMRAPAGSTIYGRSGKSEAEAREMWVVLMPNVKGEDLGLPTKRMNASSPWMMRSGTAGAHIMMPQTASMDDMPPPPPKGM